VSVDEVDDALSCGVDLYTGKQFTNY
jgi:hypothetical protein